MNEPVMIALIVFLAGALLAYATAALIKGIFWSLRFRVKMKIREQEKWKDAAAVR